MLLKQKSTTAFFNTQRKFLGPCNLPEKQTMFNLFKLFFPMCKNTWNLLQIK